MVGDIIGTDGSGCAAEAQVNVIVQSNTPVAEGLVEKTRQEIFAQTPFDSAHTLRLR